MWLIVHLFVDEESINSLEGSKHGSKRCREEVIKNGLKMIWNALKKALNWSWIDPESTLENLDWLMSCSFRSTICQGVDLARPGHASLTWLTVLAHVSIQILVRHERLMGLAMITLAATMTTKRHCEHNSHTMLEIMAGRPGLPSPMMSPCQRTLMIMQAVFFLCLSAWKKREGQPEICGMWPCKSKWGTVQHIIWSS